MEDEYDDYAVEINETAFHNDFDEIGWDPEIIDDSDKESEELYGLD